MSESIKKYWQQLESREQFILMGGGVIVVLILLYALIWQPWHKSIESMQKSIQTMRSDLVWVRQYAPIIKSGGQGVNKNTKGSDQSLLSVIESTAKRGKVHTAIQQMTPSSENKVRVVLEDANFNHWVKWIEVLSAQYGVAVEQASADRNDDKPNVVEVRVTFVR